jgi:hypothetical protein
MGSPTSPTLATEFRATVIDGPARAGHDGGRWRQQPPVRIHPLLSRSVLSRAKPPRADGAVWIFRDRETSTSLHHELGSLVPAPANAFAARPSDRTKDRGAMWF